MVVVPLCSTFPRPIQPLQSRRDGTTFSPARECRVGGDLCTSPARDDTMRNPGGDWPKVVHQRTSRTRGIETAGDQQAAWILFGENGVLTNVLKSSSIPLLPERTADAMSYAANADAIWSCSERRMRSTSASSRQVFTAAATSAIKLSASFRLSVYIL